ncbi:MAG TPA: SAM-dependent methyltransferase [Aliidongia sp.]|uniref:SAM-dependent methyltransferase n=1 Tax=Aliidongia sp. TaxID=1914230 RepID=UPI002DDD02E3|nr:SAM-dependent methyltransferase [Aliidongia sp.]HEV2674775.1 SAM-dependent methyltransferase [Aliidongia sp.]
MAPILAVSSDGYSASPTSFHDEMGPTQNPAVGDYGMGSPPPPPAAVTVAGVKAAVAPWSAATKTAIGAYRQQGASQQTQLQTAAWTEMTAWFLAQQGRSTQQIQQAQRDPIGWRQQQQKLLDDPIALNSAQTWAAQTHAADLDPATLAPQLQAASIVANGQVQQQAVRAGQDSDQKGQQAGIEAISGTGGSSKPIWMPENGAPSPAAPPSIDTKGPSLKGASRQVYDAVLGNSWTTNLAHQVSATMKGHKVQGVPPGVWGTKYLSQVTQNADPQVAAVIVQAAMPTLRSYLQDPAESGAALVDVAVGEIYRTLENAAPTAAVADPTALNAQIASLAANHLNPADPDILVPAIQSGKLSPDLYEAVLPKDNSNPDSQPLAIEAMAQALKGTHQPPVPKPVPLPDTNQATASTTAAARAAAVQKYAALITQAYDALKGQLKSLPPGIDPWALAVTRVRQDTGAGNPAQSYQSADEPWLAQATVLARQQAEHPSGAVGKQSPNQVTQEVMTEVDGMGMFSPKAISAGTASLIAPMPTPLDRNSKLAAKSAATSQAWAKLAQAKDSGSAARIAAAATSYHDALTSELLAVYPELLPQSLLNESGYQNWLQYAEAQVWANHQGRPRLQQSLTVDLPVVEFKSQVTGSGSTATQAGNLVALLAELKNVPQTDKIRKALLADGGIQSLISAAASGITSKVQMTGTGANRSPTFAVTTLANQLSLYDAIDPANPITQAVMGAPDTKRLVAQAVATGQSGLAGAASIMQAAAQSGTVQTLLYQQIQASVLANLAHLNGVGDLKNAGLLFRFLPQTSDQTYQVPYLKASMAALGANLRAAPGGPAMPSPAAPNLFGAKIGQTSPVGLSPFAAQPLSTSAASARQAQIAGWIDDAAPSSPELFHAMVTGLRDPEAGRVLLAGLAGSSPLVATIDKATDQALPSAKKTASTLDPNSELLLQQQQIDGLAARTVTTPAQLMNAVGAAYGLPAAAPTAADLPAVQAGTFSAYDPNAVVFGQTSLRQLTGILAATAGGPGAPSADRPVTLQALPLVVAGSITALFRVQTANGSYRYVGPDGTTYSDWNDWEARGVDQFGSDVLEQFGGVSALAGQNQDPLLVNHVATTEAVSMSGGQLAMLGLGLVGLVASSFDGETTAPLAVAAVGEGLGGSAAETVITTEAVAAGTEAAAGATTEVATQAAVRVGVSSGAKWVAGTAGRAIFAAQGVSGLVNDLPNLVRDPTDYRNWLAVAGDAASAGMGLSVVARVARLGTFGTRMVALGSRVSSGSLAIGGAGRVTGALPTAVRWASKAQHLAFGVTAVAGGVDYFSNIDKMSTGQAIFNGLMNVPMAGLAAIGLGQEVKGLLPDKAKAPVAPAADVAPVPTSLAALVLPETVIPDSRRAGPLDEQRAAEARAASRIGHDLAGGLTGTNTGSGRPRVGHSAPVKRPPRRADASGPGRNADRRGYRLPPPDGVLVGDAGSAPKNPPLRAGGSAQRDGRPPVSSSTRAMDVAGRADANGRDPLSAQDPRRPNILNRAGDPQGGEPPDDLGNDRAVPNGGQPGERDLPGSDSGSPNRPPLADASKPVLPRRAPGQTPDPIAERVDPEFRQRMIDYVSSRGKITFADFMEHSLYGIDGEGGYYNSGLVTIGNSDDFFTAASLSKHFGGTIARSLVDMHAELGRPSRFDVVEMGAGNGDMAKAIIDKLQADHPDVYQALRYTIVERSEALITRQQGRLGDRPVQWIHGSASALPMRNVRGVFISNELVDVFPVHRAITRNGDLKELYVAVDADGRFIASEGEPSPALDAVRADLNELVPLSTMPEGTELTVNARSIEWMKRLGAALHEGFVLTFDYGKPGVVLEAPYTFLENMKPIDLALRYPGAIDITAQVDFALLVQAGEKAGLKPFSLRGGKIFDSQNQFLLRHGIRDELRGESDPTERENGHRLLAEFFGFGVLVQRKEGPAALPAIDDGASSGQLSVPDTPQPGEQALLRQAQALMDQHGASPEDRTIIEIYAGYLDQNGNRDPIGVNQIRLDLQRLIDGWQDYRQAADTRPADQGVSQPTAREGLLQGITGRASKASLLAYMPDLFDRPGGDGGSAGPRPVVSLDGTADRLQPPLVDRDLEAEPFAPVNVPADILPVAIGGQFAFAQGPDGGLLPEQMLADIIANAPFELDGRETTLEALAEGEASRLPRVLLLMHESGAPPAAGLTPYGQSLADALSQRLNRPDVRVLAPDGKIDPVLPFSVEDDDGATIPAGHLAVSRSDGAGSFIEHAPRPASDQASSLDVRQADLGWNGQELHGVPHGAFAVEAQNLQGKIIGDIYGVASAPSFTPAEFAGFLRTQPTYHEGQPVFLLSTDGQAVAPDLAEALGAPVIASPGTMSGSPGLANEQSWSRWPGTTEAAPWIVNYPADGTDIRSKTSVPDAAPVGQAPASSPGSRKHSLFNAAIPVIKKPIPLSFRFAQSDELIQTLEGPVWANPGDAVLTGTKAENWPIGRQNFERTYEFDPAAGTCYKKPMVAVAVRKDVPFSTTVSWANNPISGNSGDYLVEYGPNDFGIVQSDIFIETYAPVHSFANTAALSGERILDENGNETPFMKYAVPDGAATPMVRLSDMGYPIDREATIPTVQGLQTKPAGIDGYLTLNGDPAAQGAYHSLILADGETGLPVDHSMVHPTNGSLAVGMVEDRPVWPIRGASPPPETPSSEPTSDADGLSDRPASAPDDKAARFVNRTIQGLNLGATLQQQPIRDAADIDFADELLTMTPHQFILQQKFNEEWQSDAAESIALHFSKPSETTRQRAQELADIVGIYVFVPRVDESAEWEMLTPRPVAGQPLVWRPHGSSEPGGFYSVDDVQAQRPLRIEDHLGPVRGVGAYKTAIQLGHDKVAIIYRDLAQDDGDPVDDPQEMIDKTKQLEALGAPHVAKIHGIDQIYGQTALLMDAYATSDRLLPQTAIDLRHGFVPVYDVSILNQNSIDSLQATKAWMVDRNVRVNDLQFLIAKDGTFHLADFESVVPGQAPHEAHLTRIDHYIRLATRQEARRASHEQPEGGEVDEIQSPLVSSTDTSERSPGIPPVHSFANTAALSAERILDENGNETPFMKYAVPDGAATPMVRLSDMGYPIDREATIPTVQGLQTKPAGIDGYLTLNGDPTAQGAYHSLVLADGETGLPVDHSMVHPTNGSLAVGMVGRRPVWPVRGAQAPSSTPISPRGGSIRASIEIGLRALIAGVEHLPDLVDAATGGALTRGTRMRIARGPVFKVATAAILTGLSRTLYRLTRSSAEKVFVYRGRKLVGYVSRVDVKVLNWHQARYAADGICTFAPADKKEAAFLSGNSSGPIQPDDRLIVSRVKPGAVPAVIPDKPATATRARGPLPIGRDQYFEFSSTAKLRARLDLPEAHRKSTAVLGLTITSLTASVMASLKNLFSSGEATKQPIE